MHRQTLLARASHPALDPGLGIALLLGLLAAWPFISRPGLPALTDAQHHVFRTYEVISAWRQGVPYLRWAPDFFYGFGYPVFNYYAPLTYYLAAAYGTFWGAVAGVKFVFVLAAMLGPAGVYMFVRDRWSATAGAAAAAVFALAPYIAYLDPQARGAAPEALALALAPWVLWAFTCLYHSGGWRDAAAASFTLAALLLAHNLLSIVFTAMLCAWLAWEAVGARHSRAREAAFGAMGRSERVSRRWKLRPYVMVAGAVGLAVGLSAFFLLPAYLERDAVQFQNAFRGAHGFRFVSLGELLAPASLADLANPDLNAFRFRLGLPQWLLGAAGSLVALVGLVRRRRRASALFFAGVAGAVIFLMLPAAAPVWNGMPGFIYLQFPWRLLGPAALALAILAGAGVHGLGALARARHWRVREAALAITVCGVCVAVGLPLLDPLPWAASPPVTVDEIFTLERSGVWGVGTTHDNEFLPFTVRVAPTAQDDLLNSFAAGQPDKVDRALLPAGAEVTVTGHGPLHDDFQVTAQEAFILQLWTFDFPGWSAWVDGQPAGVSAVPPNGWVTVRVPAGGHRVTVRLEDTPARRLAWGLTLIAAIVWVAVVGLGLRQGPAVAKARALRTRDAATLAVLVLLAFAARFAADRVSPWRVGAGPNNTEGTIGRLDANIALVDVKRLPASARAGEQVPLTLDWQAFGPVPADLSSFVHLIDPNGKLWGQSDQYVPVPFFPTGRWPFGRLMADDCLLTIDATAPPGDYEVVAGLWDRNTGSRSHVLDPTGAVTGADGIVVSSAFQLRP